MNKIKTIYDALGTHSLSYERFESILIPYIRVNRILLSSVKVEIKKNAIVINGDCIDLRKKSVYENLYTLINI